MSKPLEVGDLVMVVRGKKCCRASRHIGRIFRIERFISKSAGSCTLCGKPLEAVIQAVPPDIHRSGYSLYRLKLIPPLSELERTKEEEGVLA